MAAVLLPLMLYFNSDVRVYVVFLAVVVAAQRDYDRFVAQALEQDDFWRDDDAAQVLVPPGRVRSRRSA
jgi:hypothetical protein